MTDAIFACPPTWEPWVSPWTRILRGEAELSEQTWGILLLPPGTVRGRQEVPISCACLLVEGTCPAELLSSVKTAHVVTYGMSPRDSLTLSSLREPVLCVQRSLIRPDGTVIEVIDLAHLGTSENRPPPPGAGAEILLSPWPVLAGSDS